VVRSFYVKLLIQGSHADHTAKTMLRQRMTDINIYTEALVLANTTSTEEVKNSTCIVTIFHSAKTTQTPSRVAGYLMNPIPPDFTLRIFVANSF
jgi:hypothetical protein